jgi:WD40 repeat protein
LAFTVLGSGISNSASDCNVTINHLAPLLEIQADRRVVDWHPHDKLLAVANDDTRVIELLDSDSGSKVVDMERSFGPELISISPNGEFMANLGAFFFELINIDSGENIYLIDLSTIDAEVSHFGIYSSLHWYSDSSQVSFVNDYILYILNTDTLELKILRSEEDLDGFSLLVARWHPNGDYLAVYDGFAKIFLLDPDTLEVSDQIRWEPPSRGLSIRFAYQAMDWSLDGKQIAVIEEDTKNYRIVIWDQLSKELQGELPGCDAAITGFALSPDGTMLAVAYGDNSLGPKPKDAFIRIWDAETYELVGITEPHEIGFVELDWSPDSQQIVGLGDNGMLYTWKIELNDVTGE